MARTRIKFCGITRPQDAVAAAAAGADAIGIILYPKAPRFVGTGQAVEILKVLPPFVTPVGLFVDARADEIIATSRELGLRHIQLHGHEPPGLVAELRDLWIIKALKVERASFLTALTAWRTAIQQPALRNLIAFVLETAATLDAGGSGVENDWQTIAEAQHGQFDGLPPIIVAGGLNPQNVAGVVNLLHPWAVDVSSGVEAERGCKSPEKLYAFAEAVRRADEA